MPIRSQFDTSVGTIRIDIQDADTIYADPFSIGSLRYQFGQTPDQISIDRTLAVYSQFDVTINQMSAESIDLYERLFDATNTDPLKVDVTIIRYDGSEYAFVFELKQENIAQSEKDKTLKLKFTPRLNSNATISNVFSAASSVYPYTLYDLEGNATNVNSLPAGDFIAEAMSNIFDNSFDPFIITSNGAGTFYTNATYATHDSWDNEQRGLIVADYTSNVTFPITSNTAYTITESTSNLTNVYHDRQGGGTAKLEFNKTNIESEFSVGDRIIIDQLYSGTAIEIEPSSITTVNGKLISTSVQAISAFDEDILTNVPYKIKKFKSPADSNAIDVLKELAGIESSYFGNGFSKNFYVYPLSQDASNVVTLRYDYVNDINVKRYNNYLGDSAVRQIADATRAGAENFGRISTNDDQIIPNLRNFSAFVKGNENASKSLSINIAPGYPHLNKATLNTTTNVYTSFDSNTVSSNSANYNTIIERNLASRGLTGYMHVLTNRSGGTRIDMEYQGALSLFPYSVFQFDSTAPEKYQNKQFRIVSIQYDFVKDIIKVSAYQVSGLTTPVVDSGTGPGDGAGDGGDDDGVNRSRTIEYDVSDTARWNLIGNPTTKRVQYNAIGSPALPAPFFGTLISPVYKFDRQQGDGVYAESIWRDPVTLFQGKEIASGSNGVGYFVALRVSDNNEEVRNYTWEGDINTSNIDGLQVYEGWNIIAGPGLVSNIVDGTANIRQEAIYAFRNKYELATILEPGRGYWVYADADGTIDIKISTTQIAQADLQEEFKRVDIATGAATQSLYFDGTNTNANVNVQQLSFPPALGATFDVRINQDETNTALRDLRAVESNTINIDVQQIDSATTLNITPKIGVAAGSYYQATFLDGDKIITAQNIAENVAVDVPITTTRITLQPMGANIKLPVRARDIANDDGEILDTVPIAGVTGAVGDRIQYLNSSGELTELRTAGSADFIQTVISRPEFSSKQNNVPSKGQVLLMSYDGTGGLTDNEISGFTAGTAGKLLRVINVGSNTIVLSANDTGSSAGNRILGSDVSLGQYESATLIYVEDYTGTLPTTTIDAWIVISNT